jgi:late competence protein required for DNA uptake (superfamily II DNA/RNA helicase)
MNASTLRLVKQTQENQNRHYLMATKSRLYCRECSEVRQVTDLFPNGEAKLSCSHRRPLAFRKSDDIAAFDAALTEAQKKAAGVPVSEAA